MGKDDCKWGRTWEFWFGESLILLKTAKMLRIETGLSGRLNIAGNSMRPRSRGMFSPGLCDSVAPPRTEGAGKAGRCAHPQPRVQMKEAHELVHYRFRRLSR